MDRPGHAKNNQAAGQPSLSEGQLSEQLLGSFLAAVVVEQFGSFVIQQLVIFVVQQLDTGCCITVSQRLLYTS